MKLNFLLKMSIDLSARRCQLLDLGAWASEDRKIAGHEISDLDEDSTWH